MKTKSAAIVTIKDAPNMSKRGRNQIADWLERQASFLRNNSKQLSKRFTARYLYRAAVCCILAGSLSGCVGANAMKSLAALKDDQAIVVGNVSSVYGTIKLVRIGGTTNSVTVAPDGTVSVNK